MPNSPAQSGSLLQGALRTIQRITNMDVAYAAVFDGDEQVIEALEGVEGYFGLRVEGRSPIESTYCQLLVEAELHGVVQDAMANEITRRLPATVDGGVRAYLCVPLRYSDGELYGSLCCVHAAPRPDLDERDRQTLLDVAALVGLHLDDARAAGQRRLEQSELLDSVTHELRTPLMALRFLGEDLESSGQHAAIGRQVQKESTRVMKMIEDMMLVAAHRAGTAVARRRTHDLGALAREAFASAQHLVGDQAACMSLLVPDEPLEMLVDGDRVIFALLNLLDNAIKHSPDGEAVALTVSAEGNEAVLAVNDLGMGVDVDDLQRLGERFFRSSAAIDAGLVGTGLGLAGVRAVADLHAGRMVVIPQASGTTFELRLPIELDEALPPHPD